MAFGVVVIDNERVRAVVVCDVPGCRREIEWADRAFVVATARGAVRVACGEKCRARLLAEPNAGCIALDEYIESGAARLGVEIWIEDDEDAAAPDPRHLAAVLAELEEAAALDARRT